VAKFERNLRQGEPHAGERPDRASDTVASADTWECWLDCERSRDCTVKQPGWSPSAAGKRSEAVATDGVREATQSHAVESPVPGEHTDV
jgi:hypothetical protein